jgi:hypothetical protein
MDSIADTHDIAISPASQQLWRTVVQVTLFDTISGCCVQDCHDLIAPSFMQSFDVIHEIFFWI